MRMVVARGGVGLRVRLVGTLLTVGILVVGAVACGSAPTARQAADSSRAATPALPVVTSAAITHASATFSASATPAASHSTPTATPVSSTGGTNVTAASCTVHLKVGKVDDSVDANLTCTVRHAPDGDTSFALRFGIVDPVGRLHPFPQTCDGRLINGAGTCSQTYTFIEPFHAVPGPISGEALPSHHPIAGPSPTNAPGA